jgi:hypothetical protein
MHNLQGGSFPRCACATSPRCRGGAALPVLPTNPAPGFAHVTPIKADKMRRKTMKIITIALLINAIAELIAAFAKFINAIRHRK